MAKKLRGSSSGKKKNSIVQLKIVAQKLQKSLLMGRKSNSYMNENHEEVCDLTPVPEDVKEGHFAVIAVEADEEPKRFVVSLCYLSHPTFLRLLEQAAEEYGFDHEGALTVPCRPSELERILAEHWQERDESSSSVGVNWDSCKAMVQSY
ncbi:auxin-responsive protein SAUR50 [Ziziphus jujuba]|uniref:Auxin-responsive protein SAUR50 n=2 Tax=Ziziphus jujuba TaxID=326968 RepID=A0A6P3ZAT4_ZIZJJ|nr:auxin-responsive protein SAUR50 [Ziziphus jujuba]KAH7542682.1 hypothetical protein FEM48_Zijuj02G0100100 [Ziziphus jujuba var. spinosa]